MARRSHTVSEERDSDHEKERRPQMIRGVSQLLFNYLPKRTVDWEDGLAIVQLENVEFSDLWLAERAQVVLEEVAQLLDRWRARGGTVDAHFPDPRRGQGRFAVGTPVAISATVLDTAYLCQRCQALSFPRARELASGDPSPLRCRACGSTAVRQFGQVFVHGCGELVTVRAFLPGARSGTVGHLEPVNRPLRCHQCGDDGILEIPARSERVSDMRVVCRTCHSVVLERLTARCPRCTRRVAQETRASGGPRDGRSPVARIAMRMSRYSANDTYYPQIMTMLRLDRPALTTAEDPEQRELRSLLPLDARPDNAQTISDAITALNARLRRAEEIGDEAEKQRVLARITAVVTGSSGERVPEQEEPRFVTALDLVKGIRESLAFRTTVSSRAALVLASEKRTSEAETVRALALQQMLGLREIELVDDLPVITATFGYTRRSFQPTYDELAATGLPTEIRVFPSLDNFAANRLGRQDLIGTVPILAREGEHQGLFLALDPDHVANWLSLNGVHLTDGASTLTRILTALEPVDPYYDNIWECRVRRLVFGLVHSLSHAAMRAASWFAGLQRTSVSEYIFLPLLGTVVFDTSGALQLGGMETLVRNHLAAFLEALAADALACVYDADCIDSRGACHGCIHSPEIACRTFNHGLSRAFLVGGHVPWRDVSVEEQLIGYWQRGSLPNRISA